jgi:hypothetical protein
MERKLAAILAADVAGYSRLMGADEEAMDDALRASRAVVDKMVAAHRGRIFNTAGALLGRTEAAVRASAELLAEYPSISAELLENQGWAFTRPQEENLFLDGFRSAGVALCASDADLAKIEKPKRLPACAEEIAK